MFSLSYFYVYACSQIEKNPQNQNYGGADKQNVKGINILHLAVSGKANPLASHVMGGGDGGREEEQEKKVFTYLI